MLQREQIHILSTSCLLLVGTGWEGTRVQQRVSGLLWQCQGQGRLDSQRPCVFLSRKPVWRQSLCSSCHSSLGSRLQLGGPRLAGLRSYCAALGDAQSLRAPACHGHCKESRSRFVPFLLHPSWASSLTEIHPLFFS